MTFIRPEVRALLSQWFDALIGVATFSLGSFWMLASGGVLRWVGVAIAVIGAALVFTGIQRARFQAAKGGPGVVSVDERQISYFGPLSGGTISINEISMLMLDPSAKTAAWRLTQPGQPELAIPLNAECAELLFDVFASLPGMKTEYMLSQLKNQPAQPVVIWSKSVTTLH